VIAVFTTGLFSFFNKFTITALNSLKSSYNPLRSILEKYPSLSLPDQIKIDLKLMDFVYPKLKEQHLVTDDSESSNESKNVQATIIRVGLLGDPIDLAVKTILGEYEASEFLCKLAELSTEDLL
jgi:hypothetical protein